MALKEYVSKGNPAGRYQIVLDYVTHTGFSSEVRADGLITDGGENDFEGCDIDGSPIWITGEDKNTPNPLQTSTVAETLNTHKELMNDVVIYQLENQQVLRVKSDFNAKIKIYNLIGQLVKNVVKNNNEISIDTSQLSESVYIIRIESENKIITKK
ncbi:T9SS type A sorting domain-containing protein [Polaribacter sejongensis]|uniref:T9SS type A sorting domain-containing protein n=1 Tax=Polaribacter sejongensis TaxID=985043 RepID=UPI0035A6A6F9